MPVCSNFAAVVPPLLHALLVAIIAVQYASLPVARAQLFTCADTITVCVVGSETCCCSTPLAQPCVCCSNATQQQCSNGTCVTPTSASATPSFTSAPSISGTPSTTRTRSASQSVSTTHSVSATPSVSLSASATPSALPSGTNPPTPSQSASVTPTLSALPTASLTDTPSQSASATPTLSSSSSATPSTSATASVSPSVTPIPVAQCAASAGFSLLTDSSANSVISQCDSTVIRISAGGGSSNGSSSATSNQSAALNLTITGGGGAPLPLVIISGDITLLPSTRITLDAVPTRATLVVEGDVKFASAPPSTTQNGSSVATIVVGTPVVQELLNERAATNGSLSALFLPLLNVTNDQQNVSGSPQVLVASAGSDPRLRHCESLKSKTETRQRTFGVLLLIDSSACTSQVDDGGSASSSRGASTMVLNAWQLTLLVGGSVAMAALVVLVGTVVGYYACYRRGRCRWYERSERDQIVALRKSAPGSAAAGAPPPIMTAAAMAAAGSQRQSSAAATTTTTDEEY